MSSGKHAAPRASVRLPLPPDSPELGRWRELAEDEALTLGEWLLEAARAWERLSQRRSGNLTERDWEELYRIRRSG